MVKTYEEYYNDPSIVNELSAMREIHAIRMMIRDEREELGEAEYNARRDKRVDAFLAECKKHRGLEA